MLIRCVCVVFLFKEASSSFSLTYILYLFLVLISSMLLPECLEVCVPSIADTLQQSVCVYVCVLVLFSILYVLGTGLPLSSSQLITAYWDTFPISVALHYNAS